MFTTPSPACPGSRSNSTRLSPDVLINVEQSTFATSWDFLSFISLDCWLFLGFLPHLSWRFRLCSKSIEALGPAGGVEQCQQCNCKEDHTLADFVLDFNHFYIKEIESLAKLSKHRWWADRICLNVLAHSYLLAGAGLGLCPEAQLVTAFS